MRNIFLTILSITIVNYTYSQSPWVKEKGNGYTQFSFNSISEYNSLFTSSGKSYILSRSVTDNTLQLYAEYGLGKDWQVSGAIPYKLLSTGKISDNPLIPPTNEEGSYSALGNIKLALKRNFINSSFLLSGQVKFELPTSSLDESTGLRSGLDATSIIPSVSLGKGWNVMYGFVSVGSAIRTNDYSGDIRISGEFGTQPIKKLWVVLVLDVVSNFENATPLIDENQLQTGLFLNNQEYFAYGLKGSYEIANGIGLNAAFYGASSGNLVAKSPSVNFGVYYEW